MDSFRLFITTKKIPDIQEILMIILIRNNIGEEINKCQLFIGNLIEHKECSIRH